MTKGLHKNSLRKVDNPHQWMIDDARMALIQQIKAEVERLKSNMDERDPLAPNQKAGYLFALADVLSFLSDLEKEEKPINPTIEKLRALIKMQIRREELNFASLGGGGQTMNIGALEWVLKQLDTLQEQPVNGPFTGEQIYNFLKEQPVCEGLEDEIGHWLDKLDDKYCMLMESFSIGDVKETARYFARWGTEHLKK